MYIFVVLMKYQPLGGQKMMTFSITGSQIFFENFVVLQETNKKLHTGLLFTTLQ